MRMRNRILFALTALLLVLGMCSCELPTIPLNLGGEAPSASTETESAANTTETDTNATTEGKPDDGEPEECEHEYEVKKQVFAKALKDGKVTNTCKYCKHSYDQKLEKTGALKVLALGDTQGVEAMDYLYEIAKDGGVETVILGRLYADNATLETHLSNVSGDKKAYNYSKNTNGTWTGPATSDFKTALADEEWDVLVIGQLGAKSGVGASYIPVVELLRTLKGQIPQIVWQMSWASSEFKVPADYQNDQTTMYQAITSTVQSTILNNKTVASVIPTGTAIQNLRTSYVGENAVDDDYGLSDFYGKYAAALSWFVELTGGIVDGIDWLPADASNKAENLSVIRESADAAAKEPYKVTESDQLPTETLELVDVDYHDYRNSAGQKNPSDVYGTKQKTEDAYKLIWDGKTDTTYCNQWSGANAPGAWTSAKFKTATVINKIVLATIWAPTANLGVKVQASVNGTNWTTLYTVSAADGSFVEGVQEWKLEKLPINVNDSTAYNYIRVYDSVGGGYCLAEVEVYSLVSNITN